MVQYSGIIQNTTCSVCFRTQHITKKYPGYNSASGSLFIVLFKIRLVQVSAFLFKIRPGASGSLFRALFKSGQGIIQSIVHDSGYYSKYDLQRLVQDSGYYS